MFVCDASAEAERLMGALRNRGYTVFDVPLGLLPTRIRYETPDMVVVDADAHEAGRWVDEARAAATPKLHVVLLGQPDGALQRDGELAAKASLLFKRPLDISRTADALRDVLGRPPEPAPKPTAHRGSRGPLLVASARRPYRTDEAPAPRPPRAEPVESHWPLAAFASFGLPTAESFPPESTPSSRRHAPHSSVPPGDGIANLSPETRALLEQARRRVQSHPTQLSRPARLGMDHSAHGAVSPELLAALGEALGVGEPIVEEARTNTNETSGNTLRRTGTRATSDLPLDGENVSVEDAEQTNPGGRLPSNTPNEESDDEEAQRFPEEEASSESLRPSALSLPPLDDLSDLLNQPPLGLASQRSFTRENESEPPLPNGPSTAPAGRRSAAETAPQPTIPRAPPPSVALSSEPFDGPATWQPAPPMEALAAAIRQRQSCVLAQETAGGVRRVLLRDGDFLTLTSSSEAESLVVYLEERGDLRPGSSASLGAVPKFGRHAGAALIARGHLRQDDLWPVLRAHAEWLLARVLSSTTSLVLDPNVPAKLLEEPAVFGGAAGAEVYLDVLRRVLEPADAYRRLGSGDSTLDYGAERALLAETALSVDLERAVQHAVGQPIARTKEKNPSVLVVLYGLTELGVLTKGGQPEAVPAEPPRNLSQQSAEMDDEAFEALVEARRALVDDSDYFVILGVPRSATGYEIDRAREQLKRELDSARLTGRTAHLRPDLDLVLHIVDEAHLVLSDEVRRERYKRALEMVPP